jgi:hypothetical protein
MGALVIGIRQGSAHFRQSGEGTLEITAWDPKHVAGTFVVPLAASDGRKATVKGSFDFPCYEGGKCQK